MKSMWIALLAVLISIGFAVESAPAQEGRYSIGTAGPGGTFFAYGGGWSTILNKKLGYNTSTQSTGGSIDNAILLGNKKIHFGLSVTLAASTGYTGTAKWTKGKKFSNLRALFMMFPAPLQLMSKASNPVENIRDLAGKRVSVGNPGSTHDQVYRAILKVLHVRPTRLVNLPVPDSVRQLGDGQLDAVAVSVGLPNGTITRFDASHKVNLAGYSNLDVANLLVNMPYLSRFTIPANSYKSITKPVKTLAVWAIMLTDADLPENVIYKITKATHENKKDLVTVVKAGKFLDAKTIVNSPIPVHPGAIRYYKEQGVSIPAKLMP